jgi:protein-S-isoprenylcysteine O-methyltransferase Ste14
VGLVAAVVGIIGTFVTQVQMGTSWRVGVDEEERTDLVTTGVFGIVRNPIFAAMALTAAGLALMVPNWVALIGIAALVVAIQLQVRVVEEPYLRRAHPGTYTEYEATTGRFVAGIG